MYELDGYLTILGEDRTSPIFRAKVAKEGASPMLKLLERAINFQTNKRCTLIATSPLGCDGVIIVWQHVRDIWSRSGKLVLTMDNGAFVQFHGEDIRAFENDIVGKWRGRKAKCIACGTEVETQYLVEAHLHEADGSLIEVCQPCFREACTHLASQRKTKKMDVEGI